MPQKMKVWRHNARKRLLAELGGVCRGCGRDENEVKLTFDHIRELTPEQDSHRARIGSNQRLVMYRREAAEGLLQILCQKCQHHKRLGLGVFKDNPQPDLFDLATQPF